MIVKNLTLTEGERVTIDGITYEAGHIIGDVWSLQVIGKRGKPIKRYRAAKVVDAGVVLGGWA